MWPAAIPAVPSFGVVAEHGAVVSQPVLPPDQDDARGEAWFALAAEYDGTSKK
jgi:hypothetical protein